MCKYVVTKKKKIEFQVLKMYSVPPIGRKNSFGLYKIFKRIVMDKNVNEYSPPRHIEQKLTKTVQNYIHSRSSLKII